VRPIYHWLADRVRAHVFLCMLAYYLEWHMRQRLAPMLFDDIDKAAAEAARASVVALAQRSPAAVRKQTTGVTSPRTAYQCTASAPCWPIWRHRHTVVTAITPNHPIIVMARPTPLQHKAFALLGVGCSQ